MKFNLTYDIVTEASAEHGDFAYNGFVTRNGATPRQRNYIPKKPAAFSLREAIRILLDRQGEGPVQADECPVRSPRWFTQYGARNRDGECISVSLHLPKSTTTSSRMRVARLLRCYGIPKPTTHNDQP